MPWAIDMVEVQVRRRSRAVPMSRPIFEFEKAKFYGERDICHEYAAVVQVTYVPTLSTFPPMASATNPHLPRHHAHILTASSSLRESHPGTPLHEDDEHAPLLRPGDIERAAYDGARRLQDTYNCIPHSRST
jgi:hypothetical protein